MFVSQIVVRQPSIAHDAALRAGFQIVVAVDRHHRSPPCGCIAVDVVATVDAGQGPATLFEDAALLERKGKHNLNGLSRRAGVYVTQFTSDLFWRIR